MTIGFDTLCRGLTDARGTRDGQAELKAIHAQHEREKSELVAAQAAAAEAAEKAALEAAAARAASLKTAQEQRDQAEAELRAQIAAGDRPDFRCPVGITWPPP